MSGSIFKKTFGRGLSALFENTDLSKDEEAPKREFIEIVPVEPQAEAPAEPMEQEPTSTSMVNLHEISITASMDKLTKQVNGMKSALTKKQMVKAFEAVLEATKAMDDLTITLIDMVESAGRIYQSRVHFDEVRDGIGGKRKMVVVNPGSEK